MPVATLYGGVSVTAQSVMKRSVRRCDLRPTLDKLTSFPQCFLAKLKQSDTLGDLLMRGRRKRFRCSFQAPLSKADLNCSSAKKGLRRMREDLVEGVPLFGLASILRHRADAVCE